MNHWTQSPQNIYVAAHRGWRSQYPENTMEAFRAALELGVDQLETDVRISRDGELVLVHDKTLDRTTNGSGLVREKTLAELKKLDAGNGARIPTLEEFLELAKQYPALTLDIELKEYPKNGREAISYDVCDRTLRLLDQYGFTDRCVINTFNSRLHEYIREKHGARYKQHVYYPYSYMSEYNVEPLSYAYCVCVFGVDGGGVSPEDVARIRTETDTRIWAGAYVKDEAGVELAVQMGAELITCDNPDVILEILRKKGLHA